MARQPHRLVIDLNKVLIRADSRELGWPTKDRLPSPQELGLLRQLAGHTELVPHKVLVDWLTKLRSGSLDAEDLWARIRELTNTINVKLRDATGLAGEVFIEVREHRLGKPGGLLPHWQIEFVEPQNGSTAGGIEPAYTAPTIRADEFEATRSRRPADRDESLRTVIGPNRIPWSRIQTWPLRSSDFELHWNTVPMHLDPVIRLGYEDAQRTYPSMRPGTASAPTDGVNCKLVRFDVTPRTESADEPVLRLWFRPARYYAMLSSDLQIDRSLDQSGTTLRSIYAAGRSPRWDVVPEFACIFSLGVQLLTADRPVRTIFVRKGRAAIDVKKMYQSAAECLWPQDFDRSDNALVAAAVRALGQELLGVQDDDPGRFYAETRRLLAADDIIFTTFGVDLARWQYSVRCVVRTHLRLEDILERWPRSRDHWEGSELYEAVWQPASVVKFLRSKQEWSPGAIVAIYDALALEFPEETAKAFHGIALDVDGDVSEEDVPLPRISLPSRTPAVHRRSPIVYRRGGLIDVGDEIRRRTWDGAQEVLRHPDVRVGWKLTQVDVDVVGDSVLPREELDGYVEFRRVLRDDGEFSNRQTYALSRVPTAWSDADFRLRLELSSSSYAEALYTAEVLATRTKSGTDPRSISPGSILPHSLSLHMLVETHDAKLMICEQDGGKQFYPSHWSASIEEQLSDADIGDDVLASWFERTLREELGVTQMEERATPLALTDCRVLSILFLDDIFHFAVVGLAPLRMTANDYQDARTSFDAHVVDHEVTHVDFLDVDEVLREFQRPTRPYHPSARARMYLFLLRHVGEQLPRRLGLRQPRV